MYTDHRTLEYLDTQRDLSCRQARWQEYLAQYDYELCYVKGEDNSVADALSRHPGIVDVVADNDTSSDDEDDNRERSVVAATLTIAADPDLLTQIKEGYKNNEFCTKLHANLASMEGARKDEASGLLYFRDRLVVPRVGQIRESLYHLAHDAMGHFGSDKSYAALRESMA